MLRSFIVWLPLAATLFGVSCDAQNTVEDPATSTIRFSWDELPPIPDSLGVAGPFAGAHRGALIVAGGANFPKPVWDNDKQWLDPIYVMTLGDDKTATWQNAGRLSRPIAYGATVSTDHGVLCMGGGDADEIYRDVMLLQWNTDSNQLSTAVMPPLPEPCAYGAATLAGDVVYLCGGQSGTTLDTAMNQLWSLDLSQRDRPESFQWKTLAPLPGPTRAFNLVTAQHNGFEQCVYVISGRRQKDDDPEGVEFLKDVWEYQPSVSKWTRRSDAPHCVMAGTSVDFGQSHIFVFGGADGSMFFKGNVLKDDHPGFPKRALAYHTITDTWTPAGVIPQNHVTTAAVHWNDSIVIPTGEVRPRVRSPKVWQFKPVSPAKDFGSVNYFVLFSYLGVMVAIGLYFTRKNKDTDAYFRGGKQIPWWAAGCSIFATMLSSLTYTGIPSKAYAQDWVYAIGNFMIPVVAVIAVFVALPFYRRIDATSAYEYLEKRFNRPVRWFGSLSFTLFHIFRMAVVMSLTGLALAVATPLSPTESVLLMGVLSILYCTTGGIEAVIWTDTIQTVVLLGGALIAIAMLISGVNGGMEGFLASASDADKFALANMHWSATSSEIALWVIVIGAIAQNTSSYTADQAVVQRYMTTADSRLAARSIWTNAVLSTLATILFFGMGTALFAFYQSHPEKLDPSITTDQIFPLFIAREMPVGLAGLIVAGVFAAAQSTVSTSMNSTATTIVTDFMRPMNLFSSDKGYLRAAQIWTLLMGVLGTVFAVVFVDPTIKSLFDTFLKVIGLFMGVLGGLFILGALTTRANATGALIGALVGAAVMFYLWRYSPINGYLYTASGLASCFFVGLAASWVSGQPRASLEGLTIYTLGSPAVAETEG